MSTSNKSNAVATELHHGAKSIILHTSALFLSTFSHYSICKRTDDTRTQNLYRQVSCELKLSPIYYLIDIDALKLI